MKKYYYIVCADVESAWRKICLNFSAQTTSIKYCLDFIDKQFILLDISMERMVGYDYYMCDNRADYAYSEDNMNKMIYWIGDKIKEIDEKEKKEDMITKLTLTRIATWTLPVIKKVIFNNPATIIIWKDGTKTVVKAEGENYDPEKGLAMAMAKKAYGNQGNYYNEFKKWLPKED